MISPAREQVLITCGDGSVELFKPEELQSLIHRACIECGFDDAWLSEDMALSVEYLILEAGDKREFSMEEIYDFASRMLDETGHGNVASRFRRNCGIKMSSPGCGVESIRALLVSKGVSGADPSEADRIAPLISSALKRLGVENADEGLILALARHYRSKSDGIAPRTPGLRKGVILLSSERISAELSSMDGVGEYVSASVLSFHPVSTLFPSLKISFSLAKFAEMKGLVSPLTELCLMPCLPDLAAVIARCREHLAGMLSEAGCQARMPAMLRVVDSIEFAREYMGSVSGDDECIRGLLSTLRDLVPGDLIIK